MKLLILGNQYIELPTAPIIARMPSMVPMMHQVFALDILACCSATVVALLMFTVFTMATIPGMVQRNSVMIVQASRPPVETGGTG